VAANGRLTPGDKNLKESEVNRTTENLANDCYRQTLLHPFHGRDFSG